MINITFTKAEIFTIKYSINYVTQIQDVVYIIVIVNTIPTTKHIFDMFIHLY